VSTEPMFYTHMGYHTRR